MDPEDHRDINWNLGFRLLSFKEGLHLFIMTGSLDFFLFFDWKKVRPNKSSYPKC